jgi:3-methyladenine DNA glycosylase/8-oxoguanine DNA glycosylase
VRRPYFWTLCTAIIAQQVSSAAARTIIGRLRALYPDHRLPDAASILATPAPRLREVGVSRQKARYLHALAEEFARGSLSRVRFSRLADDEIMDRLTSIVGIGRWTAEMFLIFSMRRPDIFPVDDLGVRQGMKRFFRVSEVDRMIRRAERWRPYRTVASLYLWRGLEV